MCGIIGILGTHQAAPLLVEGLKRLEYRGYDSSGIATIHNGRLERRRAVGKLVNLSDVLVHDPLQGSAGIGQTRWATHGGVTVENAHPHFCGSVGVVHNGILENFRTIRREMEEAGYQFASQTDTECAAMLAHHFMARGDAPLQAVQKTIAKLEGAYALCFLFDGEENLMIAARKGAPLAVGHGNGENYVGSDALVLAPLTDRITYLEDGDIVYLTREQVDIYDKDGALANRPVTIINIDQARIEKGGYKHFMAKEIAQQPVVMADTLNHYVTAAGNDLNFPETLDFGKVSRITLIACGTAHYACHVAKYWFESLAGLPCDIDIASEFRYRNPPLDPNSWAFFVSQSGETADTLAALRYAKEQVAKIISIVNVTTSSIARESDIALPIHAGVEIGVASTKAFTCQLTVLALLALKAAYARGRLTKEELEAHLKDFALLPGMINHTLTLSPAIEAIAKKMAEAQDVLFLGRGIMYPIALEGALKLKEISYIHAEGYASGELKHGPIALIDRHVPIVVLAPHDDLFDKSISNMQEVMARQGKVMLLSNAKGIAGAGAECWRTLTMPEVPDIFAPILYTIPMQLLSYHTAIAKGTDVDQPRNLAKSVTVE